MTLTEGEQELVPDLRTGVAFKLGEVTDDLLREMFVVLSEREKQIQEWRRMAEDELVRRANKGEVRGVEVDRGWIRKWDEEDLAGTLVDLIGHGKLTLDQTNGIFKEKRSVDGVKLNALLKTVPDDVRIELEKCFTWKAGSRARVKVTPTQLEQ